MIYNTIKGIMVKFLTNCYNILPHIVKVIYLLLLSYIYKKMGVQMFVCMSVGMWRANGSPNPWTDLDKILPAHPHLSMEGFGVVLNLDH